MKRKIIHISDSENEDRLEPYLYLGYGSDGDSADEGSDENEPLAEKLKRKRLKVDKNQPGNSFMHLVLNYHLSF